MEERRAAGGSEDPDGRAADPHLAVVAPDKVGCESGPAACRGKDARLRTFTSQDMAKEQHREWCGMVWGGMRREKAAGGCEAAPASIAASLCWCGVVWGEKRRQVVVRLHLPRSQQACKPVTPNDVATEQC
eukprot:213022-Chlamydomonas_euryale.AAC.16